MPADRHPRPARRLRTAALAAGPAVVVGAVWVTTSALTGPRPVDLAPLPVPSPVAAEAVAAGAAGSQPGATILAPSASWVAAVGARTGIPARALQAYGAAQLRVQEDDPGCHIGWTTLAGIGAVESDHGRHDGASIGADGLDRPTVLGPPLDGTAGNLAVSDTDAGRLDGDTTWDRAVGPMQFVPQTWERWGRSATGATPDPSDIDDAALTAASYLCAAGTDMATTTGWTAAIATYNAPVAYAVTVADRANDYATRSRA